jgi:hypothetical protein
VLRDWYETHADRFTEPQTITFRHVFFSEDVAAGRQRRADAEAALERSEHRQATGETQETHSCCSAPMAICRFAKSCASSAVSFAQALAATPASDLWTGPIRSALGVHLIQVSANAPPQLPPFEEVKGEGSGGLAGRNPARSERTGHSGHHRPVQGGGRRHQCRIGLQFCDGWRFVSPDFAVMADGGCPCGGA